MTEEHRQALRECEEAVKSSVQLLSQEHKDVHAPISKFGRSIDKVSACCPFSLSLSILRVLTALIGSEDTSQLIVHGTG